MAAEATTALGAIEESAKRKRLQIGGNIGPASDARLAYTASLAVPPP
jgi:hypothetical protein